MSALAASTRHRTLSSPERQRAGPGLSDQLTLHGRRAGVYSQNLKEASWPGGLGAGGTLTQAQVSLIGAASNIGGCTAPQWGFFYDAFGPRPTVLIGGTMGVLGVILVISPLFSPPFSPKTGAIGVTLAEKSGHLMRTWQWAGLWAALKFPDLGVPFWALVVLATVQGNSQAITDLSSVPTMARLFPQNRKPSHPHNPHVILTILTSSSRHPLVILTSQLLSLQVAPHSG